MQWCGAALKHYGRLLKTPQAEAFAARVEDFSEFVERRGVPTTNATETAVVVQDPCHLRHVQKSHLAVRGVLVSAYQLLETDDDGLCCGAGGAYSMMQPDLANQIRARKAASLDRAMSGQRDDKRSATTVCSANPGCAIHLGAMGYTVKHPAELLAAALANRRTTPKVAQQ